MRESCRDALEIVQKIATRIRSHPSLLGNFTSWQPQPNSNQTFHRRKRREQSKQSKTHAHPLLPQRPPVKSPGFEIVANMYDLECSAPYALGWVRGWTASFFAPLAPYCGYSGLEPFVLRLMRQ